MDQKAEIDALLEWINSFSSSDWVESPKSLSDGLKMWTILRDIDPDYFIGDLPKGPGASGEWVSRWQNLKQIVKLLLPYLVTQCRQNPPKGAALADLQAIAIEHTAGETIKLLKLVLLIAISCPKRETYIAEITKLSTSTQMALMGLISDMQKNDEAKSDQDRMGLPSPPIGDPELLFEERMGELMADNENHLREKKELQKELRELHDRLTRLQDNNDTLQERLTRTEDKLRVANSADNAKNEASLKLMRSSLRQQEEVIATHEISQAKSEQKFKEMQMTIDKLTASNTKYQKLSDEFDVLKVERDSLAKKANTAERYKQKLESSQNLQKENSGLREELNEVREQLRSAQSARDRVAGLEVAIEEYERTLPKIEQDRHELQIVKQHLEFDNNTLAQRCEAANEQIARDKEIIANLNDKLRDVDGSRTSDSVDGKGLELELGEHANEEAQLEGKEFEFETENRLLKTTVEEQESKIKVLQQLIGDANTIREEQDKLHLETHRRLLNIESSLKAAQRGESIEKPSLEADGGHNVGSTEIYPKNTDELTIRQFKQAEPGVKEPTGKLEDVVDELEQNLNVIFESVKVATANQSESETKASPRDVMVHRQEHHLSDQNANSSKGGAVSENRAVEGIDDKDSAAKTIRSLQRLNENLRRENKLMSSAYHVLGSRLQMTNVNLQRPSDVSWLSRQRKAVDHVALGR